MGSDIKKNEQGDDGSGIENRLEKIEQKLDVMAKSSMVHSSDLGFNLASSRDDEVDLRELWNVIWAGKWIIIATTLVFALASVAYALSLPNIYKSEALLAPAEENSGGGLAGLAGQFGGLASLAGVNLGGGSSDKTALALEVLKSRKFISKFIRKHELLVPLMAAKGWDRLSDKIVIDKDVYNVTSKEWVREPKLRRSEPTMQEAHREFLGRLSVTQDKTTNFVVIGLEFYSPNLAKVWVDALVEEINSEIKVRDVAEAKRSIQYLTDQLEKTPVADMQKIFYELIEEQSKTIMFAEIRDEYVFRTIDFAVAPELRSKPNRVWILVVAVLIGGVFGGACVLVLSVIRKSNIHTSR